MATLVSRVNVSFLTPSGRTNFSAREGWFMATVLRSCAGASDCCEFPDFVPLPSLLLLVVRAFSVHPRGHHPTPPRASHRRAAHGVGSHAPITQMSSVNEVGTGAKDSPGDVDATRSNRKPPGDESSPGTRKVDATEGEGTTPQKVPKNVKIPGEGGSGMIGRMSRDWASGAKDEPGEAEIKEGGT